MFRARNVVALLVLTLVLYGALIPGAPSLLCGILVPLWLFAVTVAVVLVCGETTDPDLRSLPFLAALASRAPPIA
jgi:hypothetical protein